MMNKRQFYDDYLDQTNNNKIVFEPYTGLLIRKKKQAPSTTQSYLIQNVTRIVYLKKKTTSKLNENASPIESKFDELEFQITKSEKKSKSEYSVNNAIEQVKNNVTLEVLQGSKSK